MKNKTLKNTLALFGVLTVSANAAHGGEKPQDTQDIIRRCKELQQQCRELSVSTRAAQIRIEALLSGNPQEYYVQRVGELQARIKGLTAGGEGAELSESAPEAPSSPGFGEQVAQAFGSGGEEPVLSELASLVEMPAESPDAPKREEGDLRNALEIREGSTEPIESAPEAPSSPGFGEQVAQAFGSDGGEDLVLSEPASLVEMPAESPDAPKREEGDLRNALEIEEDSMGRCDKEVQTTSSGLLNRLDKEAQATEDWLNFIVVGSGIPARPDEEQSLADGDGSATGELPAMMEGPPPPGEPQIDMGEVDLSPLEQRVEEPVVAPPPPPPGSTPESTVQPRPDEGQPLADGDGSATGELPATMEGPPPPGGAQIDMGEVDLNPLEQRVEEPILLPASPKTHVGLINGVGSSGLKPVEDRVFTPKPLPVEEEDPTRISNRELRARLDAIRRAYYTESDGEYVMESDSDDEDWRPAPKQPIPSNVDVASEVSEKAPQEKQRKPKRRVKRRDMFARYMKHKAYEAEDLLSDEGRDEVEERIRQNPEHHRNWGKPTWRDLEGKQKPPTRQTDTRPGAMTMGYEQPEWGFPVSDALGDDDAVAPAGLGFQSSWPLSDDEEHASEEEDDSKLEVPREPGFVEGEYDPDNI